MAEFRHNPMSGSIFKNKFKEKDNQPDYTGDANIVGTIYRVSGWIKETKAGDKFLSLAFSEKEVPAPRTPGPKLDDFEDDIPF
jgi:hypothetical protein